MKKKFCIFLSAIILITGCSSKTKDTKADLLDNQYQLTATDGSKLLIALPEDYVAENDEKEQSALKAYYCSNKTEPLTLHYFKETKEYTVKDIQSELDSFESQYQILVDSNDGTIDSSTGLTKLTVGDQTGQYIALTYTLDKHTSYCAEFYLQQEDYVLHGTQRLNEKPEEDVPAFLKKVLLSTE